MPGSGRRRRIDAEHQCSEGKYRNTSVTLRNTGVTIFFRNTSVTQRNTGDTFFRSGMRQSTPGKFENFGNFGCPILGKCPD